MPSQYRGASCCATTKSDKAPSKALNPMSDFVPLFPVLARSDLANENVKRNDPLHPRIPLSDRCLREDLNHTVPIVHSSGGHVDPSKRPPEDPRIGSAAPTQVPPRGRRPAQGSPCPLKGSDFSGVVHGSAATSPLFSTACGPL